MQTPWKTSAGAALVTALMAGWAGSALGFTTVAPEYLARHYQPEMVHQAAKTGGLSVEVRGNAADGAERLTERTVAAMQGSRLGEATALSADTAESATSATKVVVLFDPSLSTDHDDACRGDGESRGTSLGTIMMTLCHDGVAVSSVIANNGGVDGVDSPAFAAMLRQAATTVFPQRGGDVRGQGFWNSGTRD